MAVLSKCLVESIDLVQTSSGTSSLRSTNTHATHPTSTPRTSLHPWSLLSMSCNAILLQPRPPITHFLLAFLKLSDSRSSRSASSCSISRRIGERYGRSCLWSAPRSQNRMCRAHLCRACQRLTHLLELGPVFLGQKLMCERALYRVLACDIWFASRETSSSIPGMLSSSCRRGHMLPLVTSASAQAAQPGSLRGSSHRHYGCQ